MPDKSQDPQPFGHVVRVLIQARAAAALKASAAFRVASDFRAVEALRAFRVF